MLARLRPHHVARLIEYQDNLDQLVWALAVADYDERTICAIRSTFQDLYNNPKHFVDVLGDGEAHLDTVCQQCLFMDSDCCFLDEKISEQGKAIDAEARARYGLRYSVYSVEELLERKNWIG